MGVVVATAAGRKAADALQRLDVADLCRRWRCSRPTIERRQRDGTLPPPLYLLQRRLWSLEAIEAAERAMHDRHCSTLSGTVGAEAGRKALARAVEGRALQQLEAAAAGFLAKRSAGDLARVIGRFATDGRIASIPKDRRAAALRALARNT